MDVFTLWVNLQATCQYLRVWWAARRQPKPEQLELDI